MMGKTHLVCGIASAMAFTKPDTPLKIVGAITMGALGGLISDTDLFSKHSHSNRLGQIISGIIIFLVALAIIDMIFSLGIFTYIFAHTGLFQVVGVIGFLVLSVLCMIAEHRKFSHSILAGLLLTLTVYMTCPAVALYFLVGFTSHIVLDLLNKRPIRLFFPIKKGVCFKLCHANGQANEAFFVVGLILAVLFTVIRIVSLFFV